MKLQNRFGHETGVPLHDKIRYASIDCELYSRNPLTNLWGKFLHILSSTAHNIEQMEHNPSYGRRSSRAMIAQIDKLELTLRSIRIYIEKTYGVD